MSLRFHGHPLSSYCWKVLIALEEAGLAYDYVQIDLGDPAAAERFRNLSPFGLMPAVEDTAAGVVVYESPIVIEHLARTYRPAAALLPEDPKAGLEVRLWDRVFDLHVSNHYTAVVFDRLRPAEARDPFGVARAREKLRASYDVLEARMGAREWVAGGFSMADCSAAPALHYAQKIEPFTQTHPALGAYLARLEARPSFARVLEAARPYAHMFPQEPA